MGTVNVNFAAMNQAGEDVRTCHNALVSEKEGLDSFLTTLHGTWGGGAADSWSGVHKEWNEACDQVNGILLQLYNSLEIALHNYTRTERALEQLWGG